MSTTPAPLAQQQQEERQQQLCAVQSLHPFKTHYVRNNRRATEKNLRCFPCCNVSGHVTQGFCGGGCLFRVTTPLRVLPDGSNGTPVDPSKMSCVVELTLCKERPEGMPVAGRAYPAAEIRGRTKAAGQPEPWTHPYWAGSAAEAEAEAGDSVDIASATATTTVVDFSFIPTHWHYGWRSNKHTNTYRHTCRIYVFHEIDGGARLLCLGSTQEGAFTISSTKKRQPEIPPGTAADTRARGKNKPKKKRRKTNKQKTFDADALTPPMSPSVGAPGNPLPGGLVVGASYPLPGGLVAASSGGTSSGLGTYGGGNGGSGGSEGEHAAYRTLSSMGFPNNVFESGDENSIGSRGGGLGRQVKPAGGVDEAPHRTSINSITDGLMMDVDAVGDDDDDASPNPFDQAAVDDPSGPPRLDKFSFDADLLDDFSDGVAQDAASAASTQGADRARQRAQQQQQQQQQLLQQQQLTRQLALQRQGQYSDFVAESDRLETVLSGGSMSSSKLSATTSLAGSASPITCERIAAASKAAVARLDAAQVIQARRAAQGGGASDVADSSGNSNSSSSSSSNSGLGHAAHRGIGLPPLHGGLVRSLSSMSQQSDKSMNDFIGAFDSFDSDVERQDQEDDIRREETRLSHALAEALYIPPSRENSGSFLAFDKIDEDRLRATSTTPSSETEAKVTGGSSGGGVRGSGAGRGREEVVVQTATVIQEGKSGSVVRAPQVTDKRPEVGSTGEMGISAARSPSGSNLARAPTVGVSMGVELAVPEEMGGSRRRGGGGARGGGRREGAGGWLMHNWRSPRFMGFALGIALIVAAIIVCVVLLLSGGGGGEGGRAGGESSAASSGSRFLRRALGV